MAQAAGQHLLLPLYRPRPPRLPRLTGQLLGGATGSVTMFTLLELGEGHLDYTNDESLLNTIAPETLMEGYRRLKDAGGACTLFGAGVATVQRRVRALQAAISSGALAAEVRLDTISLTLHL